MGKIIKLQHLVDVFEMPLDLDDKIVIDTEVPTIGIVADKVADIFYRIVTMGIVEEEGANKFGRTVQSYIKLPNGHIVPISSSGEPYTMLDRFGSRNRDDKIEHIYEALLEFEKNKKTGKPGKLIQANLGFNKYTVLECDPHSFIIVGLEHSCDQSARKWNVNKEVYLATQNADDNMVVCMLNRNIDDIFDYVNNSELITEHTRHYFRLMLNAHRWMTQRPYDVENPRNILQFLNLEHPGKLFDPFFEFEGASYYPTKLVGGDRSIVGIKEKAMVKIDKESKIWEPIIDYCLSGENNGLDPHTGDVYKYGRKLDSDLHDYVKTYVGVKYKNHYYAHVDGLYMPILDGGKQEHIREQIEQQIKLVKQLQK